MTGKTLAWVLLSGGLDSTTTVTRAVKEVGQKYVRTVSVDYGQRHIKEIEAAKKVANFYGRPHHILDLRGIVPQTMLTDRSSEIPNISYDEIKGLSPTYVPFRNGLMLSALTSYVHGELIKANAQDVLHEGGTGNDIRGLIYFGAHAEDAAGFAYPDCTMMFTGAMAAAIYVGTYYQIQLVVPWQFATKDEIVSYASKNGTPIWLSWSCYAGNELHCGTCPTCRARKTAFIKAGVKDPTEYAA